MSSQPDAAHDRLPIGRRSLSRAILVLGIVASWTLATTAARATWSIAAVDPATREVGVAIASCIGGVDVAVRLVPGVGALVAQAMSNLEGRDRLAALLSKGTSPAEALAQVASPEFDSWLTLPTVRLRQYGVVALGFEDAPAQYTGAWNLEWAGSRAGPGVAVQGNLLWRAEVVDAALEGFSAEPEACRPTLADRLIAALEAGLRAGGDRRCSEELGALSALLAVAKPEDPAGAPALHYISTHAAARPLGFRAIWDEIRRNWIEPEPGTREESPVIVLRQAYAEALASEGRTVCTATD